MYELTIPAIIGNNIKSISFISISDSFYKVTYKLKIFGLEPRVENSSGHGVRAKRGRARIFLERSEPRRGEQAARRKTKIVIYDKFRLLRYARNDTPILKSITH